MGNPQPSDRKSGRRFNDYSKYPKLCKGHGKRGTNGFLDAGSRRYSLDLQ